MYNDATSFVLLCLASWGTLTVGLPRVPVLIVGAVLVIVGSSIKLWAAATLGAGPYYWRNFFVLDEKLRLVDLPDNPSRGHREPELAESEHGLAPRVVTRLDPKAVQHNAPCSAETGVGLDQLTGIGLGRHARRGRLGRLDSSQRRGLNSGGPPPGSPADGCARRFAEWDQRKQLLSRHSGSDADFTPYRRRGAP